MEHTLLLRRGSACCAVLGAGSQDTEEDSWASELGGGHGVGTEFQRADKGTREELRDHVHCVQVMAAGNSKARRDCPNLCRRQQAQVGHTDERCLQGLAWKERPK